MNKRFVETNYIRTGCDLRSNKDGSFGVVVGIIVTEHDTTVTVRNHTGGQHDLPIKHIWRNYTPGIFV